MFCVSEGSLSGTLSACCPPPALKEEMEFPSSTLPFHFHHFSLKNQIMHSLWLKWGVWRRGPAPFPWPCSPSLHAACPASTCVLWWQGRFFFFQQGPSATWGLHICGRNTVHGPFEVIFINIQFPLTQRATQQSSPSWSCMPIICRLKLLQCASPQWGLPYLEWACETIVVIIWGLRDFNKKL